MTFHPELGKPQVIYKGKGNGGREIPIIFDFLKNFKNFQSLLLI